MKRQIIIDGDIAKVPLTHGYTATIDVADVPLVSGWNWGALIKTRKDGAVQAVYAVRRARMGGKCRVIRMHRVLSGAIGDIEVDHIDGDGLNNRRANLRLATRSQNCCNKAFAGKNSSGVKGVHLHRQTGKWAAQIMVRKKVHYLGIFSNLDDAAAAYAKASAELHGEFGRTS